MYYYRRVSNFEQNLHIARYFNIFWQSKTFRVMLIENYYWLNWCLFDVTVIFKNMRVSKKYNVSHEASKYIIWLLTWRTAINLLNSLFMNAVVFSSSVYKHPRPRRDIDATENITDFEIWCWKHAIGAGGLEFKSRVGQIGTVSPTARHRSDDPSELCSPVAKPRRWAPPLVTRFGVIARV